MEVTFSPHEQAQLDQLASHAGTDTAHLVRSAALKLVDDTAHFRAAVREGIAQADQGMLIEDREIASWLAGRESR